MSIKENYDVAVCSRSDIRDFIEKYHYSQNINGCIADHCFKMIRKCDGEIVGAMFYGRMAMANQWKKYGSSNESVTELRRLVFIDDTPKNSESFFIGWTLRWLRKNTKIETVVSYADPEYGHEGIVYKASNFAMVGQSSSGRVIIWNGKKFHDKAIRTKNNGVLKPFAVELKGKLDSGEAYYKKTVGKNIFVYKLR